MFKLKPVSWIALLISLGIIALFGCNAKPFDYQPTAGEMKPGPGVFTGEEGKLTVYDSKKGGVFPKDSDAETSGAKTAQTTEAASTTAVAAAGSQDQGQEFKDFQEFQQWQKEKAKFHEYQQWQKSPEGSADLKEFQEWREFKAYQEWKKSQTK